MEKETVAHNSWKKNEVGYLNVQDLKPCKRSLHDELGKPCMFPL